MAETVLDNLTAEMARLPVARPLVVGAADCIALNMRKPIRSGKVTFGDAA